LADGSTARARAEYLQSPQNEDSVQAAPRATFYLSETGTWTTFHLGKFPRWQHRARVNVALSRFANVGKPLLRLGMEWRMMDDSRTLQPVGNCGFGSETQKRF
jgi:hypothetical protein